MATSERVQMLGDGVVALRAGGTPRTMATAEFARRARGHGLALDRGGVTLLAGMVALSWAGAAPGKAGWWGMWEPDEIPMEPTLAVGPEVVLQAGNYRLLAYDRAGNEQWRVRLNVTETPPGDPYFWYYPDTGEQMPGTGGFDARVLYDHFAQCYIVTNMWNSGELGVPSALYLAISKDSTPSSWGAADWDKWYILVDTSAAPGNFDFPGLAVSAGWIYFSAVAMVGNLPSDREHLVEILERPPAQYQRNYYDLALGHRKEVEVDPAMSPIDSLPQDRLPMPALFLGQTTPETLYLVQRLRNGSSAAGTPARLRMLAITFQGGQPVEHYYEIGHPGSGEVDAQTFGELCPPAYFYTHLNVQDVVWKDRRLYFARVHFRSDGYPPGVVAPKRMVGHWYVVDTRGWPNDPFEAAPVLVDDGLIDGGRIFLNDDPNDDRPVHVIYPLIMPVPGPAEIPGPDFALFFSRFSRYGYVDLCWTGHRSSDAPHALGSPLTVAHAGTAGVSSDSNWGDYEGIAVDPLDPDVVWASGEVGRSDSYPECPCTPCEAGGIHQPCFHSLVSTYSVWQTGLSTLRVQCNFDAGPGAQPVIVKVMPPDSLAQADADVGFVTSSEWLGPAAVRPYPYTTWVTLRAPPLTGSNYTFDHWVTQGSGAPRFWYTREIDVYANETITATVNYHWTGP